MFAVTCTVNLFPAVAAGSRVAPDGELFNLEARGFCD